MNVIGHRGASVAQPENTPAAFAAADRMGADGVELDVRLASDGRDGARLVVFHDALPDDRRALDALPGFADVLAACGTRMLINVEIKNDPPAVGGALGDGAGPASSVATVVERTVAALRRHDAAHPDRWLLSSFSMATIDACRLVAPEFATAFLCESAGPGQLAATARAGHTAIHPADDAVDDAFVADAHRAGLAVDVWTVNDPDRIVALAAMGVDGVVTDVPDVARAALGRRGDADPAPAWFESRA